MKRSALLYLSLFVLIVSCGKSSSLPSPDKKTGAETAIELADKSLEYRVGLFKDEIFDPNKVTHIILVGSAMREDSDQFFQSGLSRAYRYKELWPERQVVIMSTPDVINKTDEQVFSKYNIKVVKKVNARFTAPLFIAEMSVFTKIASFDFYGHSSPWALKIDDYFAPFDPSAHVNALSVLKGNFLPNAYATLNGCNTGFSIAPNLSRALEIPVSGSLTSSVFERLESDGFWYKEDDKNSGQYVTTNKTSYSEKLSCATGACTRMKPSRYNYSSIWGHFKEGGLSFDKFFCNFENRGDGKCEKGMAMSLLGFPSVRPISLKSSVYEYKKVVFDWLCSTGKNSSYFRNCVYGIEDAVNRQDLIYRSHPTNELNCDFNSCNVKVTCTIDTATNTPAPGSCKVVTIPNPQPTNVAQEYLSLMRGFDQIRE